MNIIKYFLVVLAIILLTSCSKNIEKESLIKEKNLESQVYEAYEEGMKSLNEGDAIFAAKKFNEAEILFPQSSMAPKSALMAAYSYYSQNYYLDAIAELERFLRVYPSHKNIDYAHYLLAVSFYELIVDEKKDTQSISNAKMGLNLSRGDPIKYYSSDRIAQIIGNGLVTLIDEKTCFTINWFVYL